MNPKSMIKVFFDEIERKGIKDMNISADGFVSIILLDNSKRYFGTNDANILKEFRRLKFYCDKENKRIWIV